MLYTVNQTGHGTPVNLNKSQVHLTHWLECKSLDLQVQGGRHVNSVEFGEGTAPSPGALTRAFTRQECLALAGLGEGTGLSWRKHVETLPRTILLFSNC